MFFTLFEYIFVLLPLSFLLSHHLLCSLVELSAGMFLLTSSWQSFRCKAFSSCYLTISSLPPSYLPSLSHNFLPTYSISSDFPRYHHTDFHLRPSLQLMIFHLIPVLPCPSRPSRRKPSLPLSFLKSVPGNRGSSSTIIQRDETRSSLKVK